MMELSHVAQKRVGCSGEPDGNLSTISIHELAVHIHNQKAT